jgi:hypothetical protein
MSVQPFGKFLLVLNPGTAKWIRCLASFNETGSIEVCDANDKTVASVFGIADTVLIRLDAPYAFRLEQRKNGGALTVACLSYSDYAAWIDKLAASGVQRCGSVSGLLLGSCERCDVTLVMRTSLRAAARRQSSDIIVRLDYEEGQD